ncbi:MAG: GntR family transcriptional regulator YhfZ [Bacillota bacterium]|uniref:Transcriptional regulator n=1 Tax=Virgibacillus salarius TaxID=447199 RepID=A0A941DVR1_9BACI|nr:MULTISPECIES: GntR family transcriptional regulator YhfZ [Bacillaceae]NAZ07820.1 transcriptional regulator [Agaribacter marinus]MBR7795103.1 transcriptional regulator [Virgibacillus salarius]MCC2248393.1 transcriptional regulator [Virgibacillus sp. AGTR]MDY7045454.1 GntR family transcriptional regulator YhfZ [Virgibacillus sp. M23]QRZ16744.1 transcriptional regulator [Virgibacillus sp. AGTR]
MSRIWESLFSKNGLAAKEIAGKMLHIQEGDRIPRVSDLAKTLEIGNGTVQGALKVLENLHAIHLEARGHLGTFLRKKDVVLLKEIAGVGSLIGAMPLPYSPKYEGLATGLIEASEAMLNHIDLAYMRGSKQRLESLKARRSDFVIMSQLAAEQEVSEDENLEIALNFGAHTYVTAHQIFFSNHGEQKIKDGMRVGIDYTSIDQSKITLMECRGLDVELIPVNYMQLFEMLLKGDLDAAVWNADENRARETFQVGEFQSASTRQVVKNASTSVILIEKDRKDVKEYITKLDKEKILRIQQQVVNKEKLPHY